MSRIHASLLLHRGHGPRHGDLILATGARCLTLRLGCRRGRWLITQAEPHRRRYLTFRGPLGGGRGVVEQLWHGSLDGCCSVQGKVCHLNPNQLFLRSLHRIAKPRAGLAQSFSPARLKWLSGRPGRRDSPAHE